MKKLFLNQKVNWIVLFGFFLGVNLCAQDTDASSASDNALLQQYIKSKNVNSIVFDSSNIKQFWIDNSVVSRKNAIEILLNESNESELLKIQLANVKETLSCNVEVIASSPDISFVIYNSKNTSVSTKNEHKTFVKKNIVSSSFNIEDTEDFSFYIKFKSETDPTITIDDIILAFNDNKNTSYLSSPGTLLILKDNCIFAGRVSYAKESTDNKTSFIVSGAASEIRSKNKIYVSTNTISSSFSMKNIGGCPVMIYMGFIPFTKEHLQIRGDNIPYKNINNVFSIVSVEIGSNKIQINSYPEWMKGCRLVLNAKEDLSDFPNFSFVDGLIQSINRISDDRSEIVLDKPLKKAIPIGTRARIQAPVGGAYIYTSVRMIQPGEEALFSSSMELDQNYMEFSSKAFPKGTYYVIPIILSHSVDSTKENTILISDFSISY